MAYAFRRFQEHHAQALADLTVAAIEAVRPEAYSPEQVAAWAARHPGPERFLQRVQDGAWIVVAVDQVGSPVAYALLEIEPPDGGHLDMLYCHPSHTRQGLADTLLAVSEDHARASGVTRLYTEASELARSAFERAGYIVQHRRDFEIEHDSVTVPIHNYAMEKHLT